MGLERLLGLKTSLRPRWFASMRLVNMRGGSWWQVPAWMVVADGVWSTSALTSMGKDTPAGILWRIAAKVNG